MKAIAGIILFSAGCLPALAYTDLGNAVILSNGSQADTQAAIDAASDGYTVQLPAGSFTWVSAVTISGKGIKLQGAGAGRIIGRSTSSVTIGTGTKTFSVASGLPITSGQTLRVERTGSQMNPSTGYPTGTRGYMIGTVSSYSGTSLSMNITSTGGSGTHGLWIVSTEAATTITYAVNGHMLRLYESATHTVEVSGIRFLWAAGAGERYMVTWDGVGGGKPIYVHDCYFEHDGDTSHQNFLVYVNRGLLANCSFHSVPFSRAGVAIKVEMSDTTSWTTRSTMGMADTTGTRNFYVEDCDFHAFLNSMDVDNNSRTVIRHCLFDNAGVTSHGADSSLYGVRHYEFYDDVFLFDNLGTSTFPMNWLFFLRGGTGVFTDNVFTDVNSGWWGDKSEFHMAVLNLRESWGANPCYGAGIAGIQYPAPRQLGFGNVTGTAGNDSVTYKGDSEPMYIWNNSGTYTIGFADGGGSCSNPDSSADYIKEGRDYFVGTPKPGYTKYTYPHPLRAAGTKPTPPKNVRVTAP